MSKDEALPCEVVIEREIYGICRTKDRKRNKWKKEGTIYVLTSLIKASEKEIVRTAGCGSWNGGTALEQVVDTDQDDISVIGYKRMLRFEITNESGAIDGSVEKGHWIMHEYSLRDGNTMTAGKGEYVLCRIKRDDSKNTKISPRRGKNVEAATPVDDLIVPKPKRVRTEFVQEQKMECDAAPETESWIAILLRHQKQKSFLSPKNYLCKKSPNSRFQATAQRSPIFPGERGMELATSRARDCTLCCKQSKFQQAADIIYYQFYDYSRLWNSPVEAINLFLKALASEQTILDEVTFLSALTAASQLQRLDFAQQLHAYLMKNSAVSHIMILNALIALYSRCNLVDISFQIFSRMCERDAVSWNTMVSAFVQNGLDDEGLMLVHKMQQQGFTIDSVAVTALLSAASNLRNLEIGKQTHAYILRYGIEFEGMESYLIDMYAKSGLIKSAQGLFEMCSTYGKDLATWNAMIAGNTQNGQIEQAFTTFRQMFEQNIVPNAATIASILPACQSVGIVSLGKQLHGFAIRNCLDHNVFVGSGQKHS
ncbi:pentatricopeptide repeat-containing protein At5g16860-like [Rhododendron vialii]|uniref:pentatricopeptide repeat-containing protein At5g16860-like n=1 Tax=Rhododendron vialii TaxID=182163 RepID=UPI00265F11C4|nr:pentatricopeptide repeat-containing protein At5g16860-like [Rhododendron vialii]